MLIRKTALLTGVLAALVGVGTTLGLLFAGKLANVPGHILMAVVDHAPNCKLVKEAIYAR